MNGDISDSLAAQVKQAYANSAPLTIVAGGSKTFLGNAVKDDPLDVSRHGGIIDYHPSELVLTARCGTPLAEIEAALDAEGQMLAFEPPAHTGRSSFGGAIACGLSGPRRAFAGAARDFVLGARIINGSGEDLQFGGQVMKNVAGYDVSRLMTGAQGTLGVLLDISVKVLPRPECELTLAHECGASAARARLHDWIGRGIPLSASSYRDGRLHVRLSNTGNSVRAAAAQIGGDTADNAYWYPLRNQADELFSRENLWRLSLPAAAPGLDIDGQLIEWGGAQRWVVAEEPLYELAAAHGGHATRYDRNGQIRDRFQPLAPSLLALHRRIKRAFDPRGILNPGRLYREL